jgi:hypothetical protein
MFNLGKRLVDKLRVDQVELVAVNIEIQVLAYFSDSCLHFSCESFEVKIDFSLSLLNVFYYFLEPH